MHSSRITGMRAFSLVMVGQAISLIGTAMTGFGLTIWAYEKTQSATALALVGFFFVTPMLVISPVAGALVDRSNRKLMMMLSDLASGITTLIAFFLLASGRLEIWHLFVLNAVSGTFQAFQWPAYSAAISTMLPKEQYGRANGMMALAESGSGVLAPLLAGALLGLVGLQGIMLIDVITFVLAISALLLVTVPQPIRTQAGQESQGSLWKESAYGFYYILRRPSLLGLQLVFLFGNFFFGMAMTVLAPMILARTGNNSLIYGSVNSAAAAGGVVGGLAMSAWGGPKKRVHGVLAGWILCSLFGSILMGASAIPVLWAAAGFMGAFFSPLVNASNQAIWQSKVAPDVQGKVFSIRRLIAWFSAPLAALTAGPLADYVLEPAMRAGGSFAQTMQPLVGSGPGSGMALLFIFAGIGGVLAGLGGYFFRPVREVEALLPDHEQTVALAGSPAAAQAYNPAESGENPN